MRDEQKTLTSVAEATESGDRSLQHQQQQQRTKRVELNLSTPFPRNHHHYRARGIIAYCKRHIRESVSNRRFLFIEYISFFVWWSRWRRHHVLQFRHSKRKALYFMYDDRDKMKREGRINYAMYNQRCEKERVINLKRNTTECYNYNYNYSSMSIGVGLVTWSIAFTSLLRLPWYNSVFHLGKMRLYKESITVSCCVIGPSNVHFMYPWVPTDSRICPTRPYFVVSWTGLNQWMSSIEKMLSWSIDCVFLLNPSCANTSDTTSTCHCFLTCIEEHVSDDRWSFVDTEWMTTKNDSLGDNAFHISVHKHAGRYQNGFYQSIRKRQDPGISILVLVKIVLRPSPRFHVLVFLFLSLPFTSSVSL